MNVLQVNKYLYVRSGAEESMFNTITLLRRHGHKVIPFGMESVKNVEREYEEYYVKNIEYENEIKGNMLRKIYIGFKITYSFGARKKISKLVMKAKPDVAHIQKFNNTLTPSILYALKKSHVPVVQTLRDYRTVCPNYNMYDFRKGEICEACRGH